MTHIETDGRPVAVTDLAQLARCEQQILLDSQFGKQRPPARERLARAGAAEHRRHDRLARQYQGQGRGRARDARCFVASVVYGESAWQTDVLRNWRDRVLMHYGPYRHLRRDGSLWHPLNSTDESRRTRRKRHRR